MTQSSFFSKQMPNWMDWMKMESNFFYKKQDLNPGSARFSNITPEITSLSWELQITPSSCLFVPFHFENN